MWKHIATCRDQYATPVTISSGFRGPELCLAIGSSITSQHTKGQAADFEIFGVPNAELAVWIIENLDYDQLILEFHNPEEPNSGWIHCSYKGPTDNRKQTLRAFRDDSGKTQYVDYNPNWTLGKITKAEIVDMYTKKGT